MDKKIEKWTELEHLPEWDEPFYQVYTGKKHGKWVMLKTLRPEFRDDPQHRDMIEKEFDVRYNLSHPNIVMINDFEEVPGLGRCIITDDVYGDSLRKLIDEHKVKPAHIEALTTRLVDAMEYIQANHIVHPPLRAERVIFTENIGNLKMIDVGFDQKNSLAPSDATVDIYNYGILLNEAVEACDGPVPPKIKRIAERCMSSDRSRRYATAHELRQGLEGRSSKYYMIVIIFLVIMVAAVAILPHLLSD